MSVNLSSTRSFFEKSITTSPSCKNTQSLPQRLHKNAARACSKDMPLLETSLCRAARNSVYLNGASKIVSEGEGFGLLSLGSRIFGLLALQFE